jgi:hypothetical protein
MATRAKNENRGEGVWRAQGADLAGDRDDGLGQPTKGAEIDSQAVAEALLKAAPTHKPPFFSRLCPKCKESYGNHTINNASHIPNTNYKVIVQQHLRLKAQGIVTCIKP